MYIIPTNECGLKKIGWNSFGELFKWCVFKYSPMSTSKGPIADFKGQKVADK
jgi:hypothetical protein